jgi:hypothetical protein
LAGCGLLRYSRNDGIGLTANILFQSLKLQNSSQAVPLALR